MSKLFKKIDHPLAKHLLGKLRNKNTNSPDFRRIIHELGRVLAYEATGELAMKSVDIETPLAKTTVEEVETDPVVVSIMRAGNGMLEGILEMIPFARAGHIGIYRDKFINNTVEYYFKLPEGTRGQDILLIDPMLATGDTAIACIDRLKQYSVGKIKLLNILSSTDGVEAVHHFHPDVDIYTVGLDEILNEKSYIIPGLGDAGDRLYQTK